MNSYSYLFRNLTNNKGYRYVKIVSLALGMAVVMLIGLWVYDELSYNKCHENYNSIARLMRNETGSPADIYTSDVFTTGMGTLLKTSYGNHFSRIAMVRARIEERVITWGEKKHTEKGYFMQPEGPAMLSLQMVSGTCDGLRNINSILLSHSLAKKLFGEADPVGKFVKMDATWDMLITGVFKDLPGNSEFAEASYFAPLDRYLEGWSNLNIWNNYNMNVFVQIKPGSTFEEASSIIKHAIRQYDSKSKTEFFLHPMSKWHLNSTFKNGVLVTSSRFELIIMILSIGFLVLLLACINYAILSTARSEHYSKEIGIRKTLGSDRFLLVKHFFSESLVTVLFAYFISLIIISTALTWFNQIAGKELNMPWTKSWFWIFTLAFLFIINFLAGTYPAIYLSSFTPLKALTGGNTKNRFGATTREVLVIFQFTISIILIIGSIIIYKQVLHAKNRPIGYTPQGLITLYMNTPDYKGKFLMLKDELKRTGVVSEIAAANYPVISTKGWNSDFLWKGKDKDFNPSFNTIQITPEYGKTVNLQFISGRDFSRELKSDMSGVIINESALKLMGLTSPLGEVITRDAPFESDMVTSYTIIGVVKDMVKGSPYEPTHPSIMFPSNNDLKHLYIRINPNVSLSKALPEIEAVLKKIVPSSPFDYSFVDDQYNIKFQEEERMGKLASVFTFMAIIISCMGLFGFAAFAAEKRTKEIGVRRVNGATIGEILVMLNSNFTKWVMVACFLGCPLAWYAMSKWLQSFSYRTELSWWIFAVAGGIAMFIAILTVSWQSWRAATRNPVEALRYE
jgi:putative ABC transport system permease protein